MGHPIVVSKHEDTQERIEGSCNQPIQENVITQVCGRSGHQAQNTNDESVANGEQKYCNGPGYRQIHIKFTTCRRRQDKIRNTLDETSHAIRGEFEPDVFSKIRGRALLQSRLAETPAEGRWISWWRYPIYAGCAFVFLLVFGMSLLHYDRMFQFSAENNEAHLLPDPKLTPGYTRSLTRTDLCGSSASSVSRFIPSSVGQQLFDEYGIGDPRPGGYELDYLIDPELGGSDDPRNLWPQPYSAVWNARVKDALEDHLHQMVCAGQLNLSTAQNDVSRDWIAAYRKYFHTDKPIVSHLAFTKDMPWRN